MSKVTLENADLVVELKVELERSVVQHAVEWDVLEHVDDLLSGLQRECLVSTVEGIMLAFPSEVPCYAVFAIGWLGECSTGFTGHSRVGAADGGCGVLCTSLNHLRRIASRFGNEHEVVNVQC